MSDEGCLTKSNSFVDIIFAVRFLKLNKNLLSKSMYSAFLFFWLLILCVASGWVKHIIIFAGVVVSNWEWVVKDIEKFLESYHNSS